MIKDIIFEEIFKKCHSYCMPVLKKYAVDTPQAQDVFLEAVTIYWLKTQEGSLKHQENIPAFVCTTAIRLIHRLRQKENRVQLVDNLAEGRYSEKDIDETLADYLTTTEHSDKFKIVLSALNKLDNKCQKLIVAKYVYKHHYTNIAEDFSFSSLSAVKTATHRCMKKLKEWVAKRKKSAH